MSAKALSEGGDSYDGVINGDLHETFSFENLSVKPRSRCHALARDLLAFASERSTRRTSGHKKVR